MGTPPPRAAGGDPPEGIDRCFRLCYVQVELDQAARSGFDRVRLGLPGQRAVFPAGLPILHWGADVISVRPFLSISFLCPSSRLLPRKPCRVLGLPDPVRSRNGLARPPSLVFA